VVSSPIPPPEPTFTPTAAVVAGVPPLTATAVQSGGNPPPGATATAIAVTNPTPTAEPGPAPANNPTPQSGSSGWAFSGVKVYPDLVDYGVILYGDMINNTGEAQVIDYVTGTFYNEQGQIIADDGNTLDEWPTEYVPSGGQVPFVLTVEDIDRVARYDLRVEAETTSDNPRQNFEFDSQSGGYDGDLYCILGVLRNPGDRLAFYLVIAAVIFDENDQVINYDTYNEFFPEDIVGDETLGFEICIDQPNQAVDHFDLRAWGE
jgi:hypothetical protein